MGLDVGCDMFAAANAGTPNVQQEWCARAPLVTPHETHSFNDGFTSTVPNRPLRPRAEGERVWQPVKRSFLTSPIAANDCRWQSFAAIEGAVDADGDSGCQTNHHSDKLSGVNYRDLGLSNYRVVKHVLSFEDDPVPDNMPFSKPCPFWIYERDI